MTDADVGKCWLDAVVEKDEGICLEESSMIRALSRIIATCDPSNKTRNYIGTFVLLLKI